MHRTIITPAEWQHWENIARLHSDNWQRTYRGIYSDHFLDHEVVAYHRTLWRERLQNPLPQQRVAVAQHGDALLGFGCWLLDDDPVFGTLLDNLHVSFAAQQRGIGRELMRYGAKQVLAAATIPKCYLWVYAANTPARQFYARLGGEHAETVPHAHSDGSVALACRYAWADLAVLTGA